MEHDHGAECKVAEHDVVQCSGGKILTQGRETDVLSSSTGSLVLERVVSVSPPYETASPLGHSMTPSSATQKLLSIGVRSAFGAHARSQDRQPAQSSTEGQSCGVNISCPMCMAAN